MITGMTIVQDGQTVATVVRRNTAFYWMLNHRVTTPEGIRLAGDGHKTINELWAAKRDLFPGSKAIVQRSKGKKPRRKAA